MTRESWTLTTKLNMIRVNETKSLSSLRTIMKIMSEKSVVLSDSYSTELTVDFYKEFRLKRTEGNGSSLAGLAISRRTDPALKDKLAI